MKFFVQLMSLCIFIGIHLAEEDFFLFPSFDSESIPDCPKNEMYKFCWNNCSNCEQRGQCDLSDCKQKGCDCIPNFYRLTPGGSCEPVSLCPVTQCDENEVFRDCGAVCEMCSSLNCHHLHCERKCYCKEGYKRDLKGKCIPVAECPPRLRCSSHHEDLLESALEDEYCLQDEADDTPRTLQNKTQCYCKEGLKRNTMGLCINQTLCSKQVCYGNEEYNFCPRKCNTTCRNYGDPNCVEDNQCYPGCFCTEGYFMNDFRFCVKLEDCPPGSNPYARSTTPLAVEMTQPESSDVQEESMQTTPTSISIKNSSSKTEDTHRSSSASSMEEVEESEAEDTESDKFPEDDDIILEETTKDTVKVTPAPKKKPHKIIHNDKSQSTRQKDHVSTFAKTKTESEKTSKTEESFSENE